MTIDFKDSEFGTSLPIRFLNISQVTMYDSEGKEMKVPKCDECGCFKNEITGKGVSMFICPEGHE